ncbi:MAG: subclass B1 metallo-beta-lactamase [Bacteroidetes bacterium]|nr:subclass B1 metallo-beta-lactamase [Bacteroidota bacterium]
MNRILISLSAIFFLEAFLFSQEKPAVIRVTEDIEIIKLSDHAYIHTTYADMPPWKRVPSNGLIFVSIGKVFLFDTPVNDTLTEILIKWIEKELKAEIIGVIPNHWHVDCMGGLNYIHKKKIQSFAYELTRQIAMEKSLPVPSRGFPDSLVLKLGNMKVVSKFFGAAHSMDNITTWIPSEKILFAGCMVRSMESISLGHTADGDIKEWPNTLRKVMDAYPDAKIVIPGHGQYGGIELIQHTLELLKKNEDKDQKDPIPNNQ